MKKIIVLSLLLLISVCGFAQTHGGKGGYPVINTKKHEVKKQKWDKGWTPEHWGRASNNDDCADFGKQRYEREVFITANFAYGTKPSTSFGMTFGMMRRVGWFVSLMSGTGFHSFNSDGEFDRDAQSLEMPFLYGDDHKSNTRISAIVGGIVRLGRPIALRMGLGYGINELCYEGPDDTWFLDKKYSVKGVDALLGLQVSIKKVVISADAVATGFDMLEGKFGVGFMF